MPPSSSRVTVVPRSRARCTSARTASVSSIRPRISSRIAASRVRHSRRCVVGELVRPGRRCGAAWAPRCAGSARAASGPRRGARPARPARRRPRARPARTGGWCGPRGERREHVRDRHPDDAADHAERAERERTGPHDGLHGERDDAEPGRDELAAGGGDGHQRADGGDVPGGIAGCRRRDRAGSSRAAAGRCSRRGRTRRASRASAHALAGHRLSDRGDRVERERDDGRPRRRGDVERVDAEDDVVRGEHRRRARAAASEGRRSCALASAPAAGQATVTRRAVSGLPTRSSAEPPALATRSSIETRSPRRSVGNLVGIEADARCRRPR